jgi:phosphoserine phosphatase
MCDAFPSSQSRHWKTAIVSRALVATLVPAIGLRLTDAFIRPVLQALAKNGMDNTEHVLIDDGAACDVLIHVPLSISEQTVRDVIALALPFTADVIVQAQSIRRKRLIICDMDSTMIAQECIDELADYAGFKAEVAEVTERAMRGEIEFDAALKSRVALLKSLPVSVVEEVLAERITLSPGADILIKTMRKQRAVTALVSGGFTVFTGPLAAKIGFAIHRANVLEERNGQLAGSVREPILGKEAKRRTLLELSSSGIPLDLTMAVGDGANDLAMIETAGLGVAYRAKPAVAAAANARLDHADLTALLYAQGYRKEDFVLPQ